MFGVGLAEIAVIMFVAVLVFGPDKLPDLARQAARFVKVAGRMARDARDELRTELGPEYSDLELRDLDPRTIVRKHISEAMKEIDLDDDDDGEHRTQDEIAARRRQREQRELAEGELPPYDAEAT
ncbi:sec-independent translocase [Nocardioides bigeumensis]|uniref:Twin-arginine translocase subunit TatB n=1 Tax=Nocardioides bigeumensis TaxID=433657 RepID=A0ABP5K0W5_9ACTN